MGGRQGHPDLYVIRAHILTPELPSFFLVITLASTLLLLSSLVGLSGTLLNSRMILSFYALLLWPSFISILVVGYSSYKREAFSLDRKLNLAWSQWYGNLGRLIIQESVSRFTRMTCLFHSLACNTASLLWFL